MTPSFFSSKSNGLTGSPLHAHANNKGTSLRVRGAAVLFVLLITAFAAQSTDKPHWSFQPVKHTATPKETHPVDFFVEKKLREKGLRLSPPAERDVLLRRMTLDLTGLPPTPEAVEAFEDFVPQDYYLSHLQYIIGKLEIFRGLGRLYSNY